MTGKPPGASGIHMRGSVKGTNRAAREQIDGSRAPARADGLLLVESSDRLAAGALLRLRPRGVIGSVLSSGLVTCVYGSRRG